MKHYLPQKKKFKLLLKDIRNKKYIMKNYTIRELVESYSFIIPLIIFISIFIFLPVLGTIITSFLQDITFLEKKIIFFENYKRLFSDSSFYQSLRFTVIFIIVSIPIELFLGLLFAIVLNEKIPLRGPLRAFVLIPWVIPSAISARIWELIYNYNYGLANFLFKNLGIIDEPINWLGTSLFAFISIVISDVWKTTPFVSIILLAGLSAIPEEIYHQAKVDRANFLQMFSHVTLPLLKPVIIVALLFRTIDALRVFDIIYVLTSGGPGGATTSVSLYSYKYFLVGDFGYGCSISVMLFLIAFILSILYIKFGRFYQEII